MGLPLELQGKVQNPVDRIEPVELALAGLADCIVGMSAVHAVTNGIDVGKISATVRAPKICRRFLQSTVSRSVIRTSVISSSMGK